jgi:hypothetical protein
MPRAAAEPTGLHVFEAMPHGGFGGSSPEDMDLIQSVLSFIEKHLRRPATPR